MFRALSTTVIKKGKTESLAGLISNGKYYSNTGIPSGHATAFSYSVASYLDDATPDTLTNGKTTGKAMVELENVKNSCTINKAIFNNVFFDGNYYDTDGNGAALEAEVLADFGPRTNRAINKAFTTLLKECVTGINGVLLNPFESGDGTETARYAKYTADVVDVSGKYGQELNEAIQSAVAIFADRKENENIPLSDLKLLVPTKVFLNLSNANLMVTTPEKPFYAMQTGVLKDYSIQVIACPYLAKDTEFYYGALLTSDAFAFAMYELDPIKKTDGSMLEPYRPGTKVTNTIKFSV